MSSVIRTPSAFFLKLPRCTGPKLVRLLERLYAKFYSLLISGGFAEFGSKSVIVPPFRFSGEERIAIGSRVFIGGGSWIAALENVKNNGTAVSIGSDTSISGVCAISAISSVIIEDHVLFALNVQVSDHKHRYDFKELPIKLQGIDKIAPVRICQGSWIGQNVVICPGVTVGRGAVIGANSLVNRDVPEFSVAAGSPARIIKDMTGETFRFNQNVSPDQSSY
jgi:acetyltransferase-like isoleucine patch superfamily enzyme